MEKACKKCGTIYPITREFFGNTPSGGFRGTCRKCMVIPTQTPRQRELAKERAQKRYALAVDQDFSFTERKRLRDRQKGLCLCCCQPIISVMDAEVDHMHPVSRGGQANDANLMLAHAQCNREKHAKTLEEHWDWRFDRGIDRLHLSERFR